MAEKGSAVRAGQAGAVTGGGSSQSQIGGGSVDLGNLIGNVGGVSESVGNSLGSIVDNAISGSQMAYSQPAAIYGQPVQASNFEPVNSRQANAEVSESPQASNRVAESTRTQQHANTPTRSGGSAGSTSTFSSNAASPAGIASAPVTMQSSIAQPAMHPGSNLVLNMQSGRVSASSGGGGTLMQDLEDAGSGSNQLESDHVAQPSRARYNTTPKNPLVSKSEQAVENDIETTTQDRSRILQAAGRAEMRREGVVSKPEPPKALTRSNRRFGKIRTLVKEKMQTKIKSKSFRGTSFYETMFSQSDLMPHCVSIGADNLMESLREPNSGLLELVNRELLKAFPEEQSLELGACLDDVSILVDVINRLNIEVVLQKTPVNINHSIQVRTLRAHDGRGIGLHPTQTKAFNADYDGDPAFLNIDQSQINKYARAMDRLISSDGTALIDPSFFPLEPVEDRGQVLEMLSEWPIHSFDSFAVAEGDLSIMTKIVDSWPSIANHVFNAYSKACNEGDWTGLLRKIDEIADDNAEFFGSRGQNASGILMLLYNFSIDRRAFSIRTQMSSFNREHSNYNPPKTDGDPFVVDLVNLTDEIIAGRPCPSFIEFTSFYNKFYGDLRGKDGLAKNVPFRLLADFAKAINRTDMISIGSDLFGINSKGQLEDDASVSIFDLWQFTCAAGLSKQISGRCYMGSHNLAVSTHIRSRLLSSCPIMDWKGDNQAFREWLYNFRDAYNLNKRMLKISQVGFRAGMMPVRDKSQAFKEIGSNLEGIADALVEVYGQRTVGSVFPNLIRSNASEKDNSGSTIARYYANMPLGKFVMNNRLVFNSEGDLSKLDAIKRRVSNGTFDQMDILMLIADNRTKQLGDYNDKWMKMTDEHFDAVDKLYDYIGDIDDFNEYSENIMNVIQLMSPDMFLHFEMDSPSRFKSSKWGKRLIDAKSRDEYRSTLFSMMIEYRLGKSSKILDEMADAEESTLSNIESQVQKLEDLDAAFENEMEILGSSSMAWHTIVEETMNGSSVFHQLMQNGSHGRWVIYGKDFWNRPMEEKEKYYSLINFLKSSEPIDVKLSVLADVVRVNEQYANTDPKEMLGQIAHHPDRLHAGNRFDMDSGIRSDIDSLKESMDRLSSYKSSTPDKIREEADRLLSWAWSDTWAFQDHLSRIATDPGYAVYVDTVLAADAIASVYEKTYNDSEKIRQQSLVNGYFGCLSYQRNGGYYTHLYMTDNAVVNTIGFDQLTAQNIVMVLADPTLELTVYDEFGTPTALSRLSLCGGNTIEDVIIYLEQNPRIALQCRRFMAGVAADVKGTAKINSLNDYKDKLDESGRKIPKIGDSGHNRVFSLLNDRPRFLATAALVTSGSNDVGRNMSEQINGNINDLCRFIASEAQSGKNGMVLVSDIEKALGVNQQRFLDLRKQGSFDENEITDFDLDAAAELYSEVVGEMLECIDIVRKSGVRLPSVSFSGRVGSIDKQSMIAYYDARQQMSGARTNVMIGVEGTETTKNLVIKTFLKGRPDSYTMSSDGTTVIPLEGDLDQVSDRSLVRDPSKLTSSICKFLEVKREMGAEAFNAKYKKYGDDGSNSILKFTRIARRSMLHRFGKPTFTNLKNGAWSIEDADDLVRRIVSCENKFEAVPILAQALIDADIRLGYIDVNKDTGLPEDDAFIPSDYWNRADLMLAQNTDGTIVIRTLEQLSAACRTRLSDEAVTSGDIDMVRRELEQIVATVGTDLDPMYAYGEDEILHNCVYGVSLHSSISAKHRVDRALRPRSSSTERNYNTLHGIYEEFLKDIGGNMEAIPSRRKMEELSIEQYNAARTSVPKAILDQMKGLAFPKDKWNPEKFQFDENLKGDRTYLYDFLGTYDSSDMQVVPGPTSMMLFYNSKFNNVKLDVFNSRLQQCFDYGITAAFSGSCMDYLSDEMIGNLVKVSDDIWILPCFDIRINGMFGSSIMAAPAEIPMNPDNMMVNVEDTTGEFREGDATYHITKELADRIKVNFRGSKTFTAERLFPNVMRLFPKADYKIDYCTNEEVQKYVLNAGFNVDELTLEGFDDAIVDIGVIPGNPNFEREKRRFALRLQEYQGAFQYADQDGILKGDCRYDSIIGFVKIVVNNGEATVLAPIWPFHLEESGQIPTVFGVNQFQLDHDTSSFVMDWSYTGGIEDQYIKAFEGIGASNKLITSGERAKSRTLQNGMAVDGFYSTESVASRLFASNKRIHTLISAIMMTRMDPKLAYNFAMLNGAFPDKMEKPITRSITNKDGTVEVREIDPKSGLVSATLGIKDWMAIRDANIRYHVDPEINKIVKWFVDKCCDFGTVNPTTILATKSDKGILWPKITEFEAFMDTGYNFQNAFMKLMHTMNETLMPENIEGNADGCLFIPVTDSSRDDYGVLQMLVPHFDQDGIPYDVLENVYISPGFFGNEFSGFKKVNMNAFKSSVDAMNVSNQVNGDDLVQLLTFARCGMADVPTAVHVEAIADNAIKNQKRTNHVLSPYSDGITHVNVYSKGNTDIGKFLSNFARTPIDLPEGRFESIEGYWHYLGLPDDCPERYKLKSLYGYQARSEGQRLRKKYGTVQRNDFKDKIRNAIDVKLDSYRSKWSDDELRYMPLEHYYVSKNGYVKDQRSEFGWFTDMLEEELVKME